MKRTLTVLTAGAFLLLTLTACGGAAKEADFRSAQDTQKELLLTLGMTKDALEEALGVTLAQDPGIENNYLYPDSEEGTPGTFLIIQDGLLQGVDTQSPALKLQGGFGVGSQISQLGDGWALTRTSDTVDSATRYFDQDGNLLLEATGEAVVMQTLTFFNGEETAQRAALYTLN